ncbi:hypothetical protein [Nonomuraea jabiensis]|uniref:hypothetical protein n=1 Tax=Nonomuraea jabiensis TaxID=882448 RepID=UPI003D71463A
MTSRSRQIHTLARKLGTVAGVEVEALYTRTEWDLTWSNGPSLDSMRGMIAQHAPGLDISIFRLRRIEQADALAVQAVRFFRSNPQADQYRDRSSINWQLGDQKRGDGS